MMFFSFNILNVNLLKCVSMNNQECKIRSEAININSNELVLYPYCILVNKCSGSYNDINVYKEKCVFLMLLKA